MSKLTIKQKEDGKTQIFIDDKEIERVYEYYVSEKANEPIKATISFYPTGKDIVAYKDF